jgi:hypothetical protein
MGYYHIELSPDSKHLCTIVLPWGKYEYQKLPMGLSNSPDIFQEKMSTLFGDLEYVRTYINDLLITTMSNWDDHLRHLDIVFHHLQQAGLKVNVKKSFFGRDELEYLGYWITSGREQIPKYAFLIVYCAFSRDIPLFFMWLSPFFLVFHSYFTCFYASFSRSTLFPVPYTTILLI